MSSSSSKIEQIREYLLDEDSDAIILDGLDDAILGVGVQHGSPPRIVYDRDLVVRVLVQRDGMTHERAEDFCAFNIDCLYAGPGTPIILHRLPDEVADVEFSVDES